MDNQFTAYIGLLLEDGSEPSQEAGYARVVIGEVSQLEAPVIQIQGPLVFPDAIGPGFGEVVGFALFDVPVAGKQLRRWTLPNPVLCHTGTVPFIYNDLLYRGVDVSAQVQAALHDDACFGRK